VSTSPLLKVHVCGVGRELLSSNTCGWFSLMIPLNGSSLVMVFVNPVLGPVVNVLMLETDVVDVPLERKHVVKRERVCAADKREGHFCAPRVNRR
jgi:hypothetical protein